MNSRCTPPPRGFPAAEFAGRLERAQEHMAVLSMDAMLLTTDVDIRYFSGFLTQFFQSPTRTWFLVVPKAGKPVAALCHGVEILTAAGCISGRTLTPVAKCALDVEQGGATYVDEPTVIDGNLVTARTWHDNTPLLKAFVQMLKDASA